MISKFNIRKPKTFSEELSKCIKNYCRTSNLHGFHHIVQEGNNWCERIFWIILCILCITMGVSMMLMMWQRFDVSPTSTTIEDTSYSISEVEFPAITICNSNKISADSAKIMIEKFVSHGIEESHITEFLRKLPQTYAFRSLKLENETEEIERITEVMKLLGYDLETLMFEITQPCEKLLVRCLWLGEDKNCSDMFQYLKTPEGFCCSFNWQGPPFKGYPNLQIRKNYKGNNLQAERIKVFVNEASTVTSGLTVVINSEEDDYFASIDSFFGASIHLHKPTQYPDIYVPKSYIQPKFEVMIRLRPTVIESTTGVRSLSINQRQCFFPDEVDLDTHELYSYEACTLQYKTQGYIKQCGCIPFYYPNANNITTCGIKDTHCLTNHRELNHVDAQIKDKNWTIGQSDRCLPACSAVSYDWLIQMNKIYISKYAPPIFNNDFKSKSLFHVFFEDNNCIKYRTESLKSWETLIASFGGIFGLCLGGSVVSLIEILYHFPYTFIKGYIKRWKRKKQISSHKENKPSEVKIIKPTDFEFGKIFKTNSSLQGDKSNLDCPNWIREVTTGISDAPSYFTIRHALSKSLHNNRKKS